MNKTLKSLYQAAQQTAMALGDDGEAQPFPVVADWETGETLLMNVHVDKDSLDYGSDGITMAFVSLDPVSITPNRHYLVRTKLSGAEFCGRCIGFTVKEKESSNVTSWAGSAQFKTVDVQETKGLIGSPEFASAMAEELERSDFDGDVSIDGALIYEGVKTPV